MSSFCARFKLCCTASISDFDQRSWSDSVTADLMGFWDVYGGVKELRSVNKYLPLQLLVLAEEVQSCHQHFLSGSNTLYYILDFAAAC